MGKYSNLNPEDVQLGPVISLSKASTIKMYSFMYICGSFKTSKFVDKVNWNKQTDIQTKGTNIYACLAVPAQKHFTD